MTAGLTLAGASKVAQHAAGLRSECGALECVCLFVYPRTQANEISESLAYVALFLHVEIIVVVIATNQ